MVAMSLSSFLDGFGCVEDLAEPEVCAPREAGIVRIRLARSEEDDLIGDQDASLEEKKVWEC
jgi:hypothetical protein